MSQQKWPKKLTTPKNPFSHQKVKSAEEIKEKIWNMKPNKKFHDFFTIQWLRHRFSEDLIKKSVFSLLPDNGKPVVDPEETEEQRKHRILMEWLEGFCKPVDKYKNVNINPKYFFNDKTYEKVIKLKEIFLQFDEDGSRKMEIDEMEEMFNINHIATTMDELVNLFFKDKVFKPEEMLSLSLDFYQFMMFALTKDQDFRLFMRGIKEKYKKGGLNQNEKGFLPMSFNLVLDYFIIKGKERASIEVIQKACEEMDAIISSKSSEEINSKSKVDQISYYDSQFEKINFDQLIEEFSNLFRIKDGLPSGFGSSSQSRKKGTMNRTIISSKDGTRKITINSASELNTSRSVGEKGEEEKEPKNVFSELVGSQKIRDDIDKLNYENYNKFKNVQLALKETRKEVFDRTYFGKVDGEKNDKGSNRSTMYGTSFLPKLNTERSKASKVSKISVFGQTKYSGTRGTWVTGRRTASNIGKRRSKIRNDFIPPSLLQD